MKQGIALAELERMQLNAPWPSKRLYRNSWRRWYVPAGSRDLSNSSLGFYAVKRVNKSAEHPVVRRILAWSQHHE